MALSDPIADGLTIIRNSVRARKDRADIKSSKLMISIVKLLKQEKFIYDYRLIEDKKQGILRVYITKENQPLRHITQIMRISKPGLRRYSAAGEMPKVLNGLGMCIVSTPQGVITGEEARRRNVGGELLAKVW